MIIILIINLDYLIEPSASNVFAELLAMTSCFLLHILKASLHAILTKDHLQPIKIYVYSLYTTDFTCLPNTWNSLPTY